MNLTFYSSYSIVCPHGIYPQTLCLQCSSYWQTHYYGMQPHKCPCCDGFGKREAVRAWDTTASRPETCVACSGTGVLWR